MVYVYVRCTIRPVGYVHITQKHSNQWFSVLTAYHSFLQSFKKICLALGSQMRFRRGFVLKRKSQVILKCDSNNKNPKLLT